MSDTSATGSTKPDVRFRDAWRLVSGYWRSDDRAMAWLLLLLIPGIHGLMVYQGLVQNRLHGAMFDALDARDVAGFWKQIGWKMLVMLTWVASYAVVERLIQVLVMRWRTWINGRYIGRWLDNKAYYRLDRSGAIDNPDQRLSDDMLALTERGLKFAFEFLHQMGMVVVFGGVLWNLSRDIDYHIAGYHIAIPGLLLIIFVSFCLASTGLVEWLGRPLLRARYRQHAREGDYRFGLVRVRENVEPIALYAGERAEQRRLGETFAGIRLNWRDVVRHTFGVNLSMQGSNQAVQILPWVLGAGAYFAGALTLGGLTRMHQACNQLRIGLLWFIQNYPELADVRASIARLCELDRMLDVAESGQDIHVSESGDDVLRTRDLALSTPDGRVLSGLGSIEISPGTNYVIVGPSGCGKSTFLLSLAGLWPHGHGKIEIPAGQRSMFIPQRPYVPIGTLKEALCYPGETSEFSDAECIEVLEACRLGHYVPRLDDRAHWGKRLSPGEQQRLAFGRALLQKPQILFLDEATSALDTENEKGMYALVREWLPGCTVVSVAHRESVRALHQCVLDFTDAEGSPA